MLVIIASAKRDKTAPTAAVIRFCGTPTTRTNLVMLPAHRSLSQPPIVGRSLGVLTSIVSALTLQGAPLMLRPLTQITKP